MRYSIIGVSERNILGEKLISEIIENIEDMYKMMEFNDKSIRFEIWLNTEEQKDIMFEDLKSFVDEFGGEISWHLCSHWSENVEPCVIEERYGEISKPKNPSNNS